MTDPRVLVALGSNLGDPLRTVEAALLQLERRLGGAAWRASSLWQSRPLDCPPDSPDFVNAVIACAVPDTPEWATPRGLLAMLQALERNFGRPATRVRNAPRPLDLDLLLFADVRCNEADCVLPHPRALGRRFVLEPAAEVAPDLIWPGTGQSVCSLCEALRAEPGQTDIQRIAASNRASN
ncbi:MAG: 2-amino-4-hydroxy-6-hydroxymethyldihydropteridine diphosphokinase [Gammaproteobacteria bacterium]|nr:MAG: 2-amino-4-hydroxy-6-hydroxymethyldihydropteridine diphosphokinase [Gammaproteobacteria bacterium]